MDNARAQQRRVGLALDERQAGQVPDFARIQLGLVGEVVLVDRLVMGHLGGPQRVPQPPLLADGEFFLQDQVQTIVFAALAVSRWIEHQTGWSIRKFVKTARRYRTIQIQAGDHVITAADPIPDDLRQALHAINDQPAH